MFLRRVPVGTKKQDDKNKVRKLLIPDIEDLQDNFVPLKALDTPTDSSEGCGPSSSISTAETAVPPLAPTSELSWPPEAFDALSWHVGTANPAIVTNLRDSLPVATVLHHIELYKRHLSAHAASDAIVPLPDQTCAPLRWPSEGEVLDRFRLRVCNRLHAFNGGADKGSRLTRNSIKKFIEVHIDCGQLHEDVINKKMPWTIRQWYRRWM